jgi:hypothetical protein
MSIQSLVNIELAVLIGTLIVAYISALIYGIVTCEVDNVAIDVSDNSNKTGGSSDGTSLS